MRMRLYGPIRFRSSVADEFFGTLSSRLSQRERFEPDTSPITIAGATKIKQMSRSVHGE
jgi:hypothetical protein